jgi:hypothetical protein
MPSPPETSIEPISDVPNADPPLNVEPAATLRPIDVAETADVPVSLDLQGIASPPAGQFGSDDPPSSPVHLEDAVSAEAKADGGDALEGHSSEDAPDLVVTHGSPPAQETDEPALSAVTGSAPHEVSVATQLANDNLDTPDQMEVDMPTSDLVPKPTKISETSLAPNPDEVGLQDAERPATADPQTADDTSPAEQSLDDTDADLPLPEEAALAPIADDASQGVVDHRSPPLVTDPIVEPMDVDAVADAVQGGLYGATQESGSVRADAEHNEADLVMASTSASGPASAAAEAEGEEELDDAMDVDVDEKPEDIITATHSAPVASDSAPDELVVAEVGTPSSTKLAPKSKSKSKSKAAGRSEADKPGSKKAATKEKPKSDKKGGQGSKAKTKVSVQCGQCALQWSACQSSHCRWTTSNRVPSLALQVPR